MIDPVTWWNINGTWSDTFRGCRIFTVTDEAVTMQAKGKASTPCPTQGHMITIPGQPEPISRFQAMTEYKFRGNYRAAMSEVEFVYMNSDIPYIRVGTDYFKIILKRDRYGVDRRTIKGWKKEEIKLDHGSDILTVVHRFDDFCIVPDNMEFNLVQNNCYNIYAPFNHQPHSRPVHESQIPVTMGLMRHVFGDQLRLGLIYFKVLYELPKQHLPILTLVSPERSTGKTTVLNWIEMIFGDNYILINPEDLSSSFNSSYATKNIIAIEETLIEKVHAGEKLKAITTAKSISVNQKHVANYSLPFFGKVILCTNKEKDFMRVDEEEIRFWVRRLRPIDSINTAIEDQLMEEIPMFLRYIKDLPPVDLTRSRMVFTPDELANEFLQAVKMESYSGLRKELRILIENHFNQHSGMSEFRASASDIKTHWFPNNNQITHHYISKVLRDEMKMVAEMCRYNPMGTGDPLSKVSGRCYTFYRSDYAEQPLEMAEQDRDLPF